MEERPSHPNPIVVTFSRKSRLFPDCSLVKQSVYSGVFVKAHVLCICDCLQHQNQSQQIIFLIVQVQSQAFFVLSGSLKPETPIRDDDGVKKYDDGGYQISVLKQGFLWAHVKTLPRLYDSSSAQNNPSECHVLQSETWSDDYKIVSNLQRTRNRRMQQHCKWD